MIHITFLARETGPSQPEYHVRGEPDVKSALQVLLAVMLEGNGRGTQRRVLIELGHERATQITLEHLHEALGHTAALWAAHLSSHRQQAHLPSK